MHYDLVIVGGGMVGASLAVALQELPLKVALIDARMPKKDDARLFALNQTSCQFFKNLNLWDGLAQYAGAIHQVHVSRAKRFGVVHLKREDVGLNALGNVVPACYIEQALNEKLASLKNVTVIRPATLEQLSINDDTATLSLNTGQTLEAKLVVGADGAHSTVRKLMKMAIDECDYQQSAIVTRTDLNQHHQNVAYERFTNNGTIAMLPLPNNQCATIWSGDKTQMAALLALSDEDFLQQLQKAFGQRLGQLKATRKRFTYPLHMVRAKSPCAKNVVLVGNAAHTLHPIAAQGFNLALYEVAELVEAIEEQCQQLGKLDGTALTTSIATMRSKKQSVLSLSHRLTKLFASKSSGLKTVVQVGMLGLDLTRPLRSHFIKRILGTAGSVPRLLLSMNEL